MIQGQSARRVTSRVRQCHQLIKISGIFPNHILGALRAVDVLYGKGFSAIREDADDLAPDSAEAVEH